MIISEPRRSPPPPLASPPPGCSTTAVPSSPPFWPRRAPSCTSFSPKASPTLPGLWLLWGTMMRPCSSALQRRCVCVWRGRGLLIWGGGFEGSPCKWLNAQSGVSPTGAYLFGRLAILNQFSHYVADFLLMVSSWGDSRSLQRQQGVGAYWAASAMQAPLGAHARCRAHQVVSGSTLTGLLGAPVKRRNACIPLILHPPLSAFKHPYLSSLPPSPHRAATTCLPLTPRPCATWPGHSPPSRTPP